MAAAACVNKERIFGKKEALFDAVLAAQLQESIAELSIIQGEGPAAVGEYAGRLYDLYVSEPAIARLLFWEGLERRVESQITPARSGNAAALVRTLEDALPGVDPDVAGDLLITLMTLCSAWMVLPQLQGLSAGPMPDRTEQRRKHIVRTAALLAEEAMVARAPGEHSQQDRKMGT